MIALERTSLAWAVLVLTAATVASAEVERIELRIVEPIRLLQTLAAEKALLGVPGIQATRIDFQRGALVVTPVAGSNLDPASLPETIQAAGVRVTHLGVTAGGTLAADPEGPTLEMEGSMPRLALSGGAKIEELIADGTLAGKILKVSGTYTRASGGNPPTLSVEEWAVPPPPAEAPPPDLTEPAVAR